MLPPAPQAPWVGSLQARGPAAPPLVPVQHHSLALGRSSLREWHPSGLLATATDRLQVQLELTLPHWNGLSGAREKPLSCKDSAP